MVEYLSLDLGNIDSVVFYTNQFSTTKKMFFLHIIDNQLLPFFSGLESIHELSFGLT